MRTIEKNMITAINTLECGQEWQQGNTRVVHRWDGVICVYLHGNNIAVFDGKKWLYSLCGWNTPTTRSRLNALGCGVLQEFHAVPQRERVVE